MGDKGAQATPSGTQVLLLTKRTMYGAGNQTHARLTDTLIPQEIIHQDFFALKKDNFWTENGANIFFVVVIAK